MKKRGKSRGPSAEMPKFARANGLWGGPPPTELVELSYAERMVIQLASLYISVKRVYLDSAGGARMRSNEAPSYHEKNVVAYPQCPDLVRTALGLLPSDLPKTLAVQFVGNDRSSLRRQAALCVSVQRLRAAFAWLTANCWVWMEATKN